MVFVLALWRPVGVRYSEEQGRLRPILEQPEMAFLPRSAPVEGVVCVARRLENE